MNSRLTILFAAIGLIFSCNNSKEKEVTHNEIASVDTILKIEMNLCAFGVEADFPNIIATIDFLNDSSYCYRSFYNPIYNDSTYYLTDNEKKRILNLLKKTNLKKLQSKYALEWVDQPTSTTVIYTTSRKYEFEDYGLEGDKVLKQLYEIVYKY